MKVSQDFNRNVQAANSEINKQIDKLKQQLDKGQISQSEYDRKVSNWQNGSILLNSIAAGLGAPTDSVAGMATATLAPAVSYQIGQEFKKTNEEGSLKHILAHAIVGAVVAQSGGNNALAGALSAGGAEALAPKVAEYLYGKKGSELTAEQKETVSSISNLLGAATGAVVGNSVTDAVQGSLNAQGAVENNSLFKPNNTVEAKARQAILEGNIGELEVVLEAGGLIGEDLFIAQRALTAMRGIGTENAKLLASRYGVGWLNKAHHAFTNQGHKGAIGDALIKNSGSIEKAFVNVQRALDSQKFTSSGFQVVTVTVKNVQVKVRVFIERGVARISTIEKW